MSELSHLKQTKKILLKCSIKEILSIRQTNSGKGTKSVIVPLKSKKLKASAIEVNSREIRMRK